MQQPPKSKSLRLAVLYLPPLNFYRALLRAGAVYLDTGEEFRKQTYRNRCLIDSPNGLLTLSVPVIHGSSKRMEDMRISYAEKWWKDHLHALRTTYKNSPFYDYLEPDITDILEHKHEFLADLNRALITWSLDMMRVDCGRIHWSAPPPGFDGTDLRRSIDPKKGEQSESHPPYPQVFNHKHGFLPDLSIIDLLANEGPQAKEYLMGV